MHDIKNSDVGGYDVYEYFKMLKKVADEDSNDYDIADITRRLAVQAGYHRAMHTLKNGLQKERTEYYKEFDSVLTAKWLLTYKKLFILKLYCHPELEEYHVQIINDTFIMFMNRLQLDKLVDERTVSKYVYMTLYHRITQTMIEVGSLSRVQSFESGGARKFRDSKVLNRVASSYDAMLDSDCFSDIEDPNSDKVDKSFIMIDLKRRLSSNPFGIRLLNAMLDSNKQVHLASIDLYVELKEEEKTKETKKLLLDAWNTIVFTLKEYREDTQCRRWRQARAIHFSDEE